MGRPSKNGGRKLRLKSEKKSDGNFETSVRCCGKFNAVFLFPFVRVSACNSVKAQQQSVKETKRRRNLKSLFPLFLRMRKSEIRKRIKPYVDCFGLSSASNWTSEKRMQKMKTTAVYLCVSLYAMALNQQMQSIFIGKMQWKTKLNWNESTRAGQSDAWNVWLQQQKKAHLAKWMRRKMRCETHRSSMKANEESWGYLLSLPFMRFKRLSLAAFFGSKSHIVFKTIKRLPA